MADDTFSGRDESLPYRWKFPRFIRNGAACQKASQSLPPQSANKVKSVFCRGVYLAENTSQTASVEFVPPLGDKLCTQQAANLCRKSPKGFSDSLKFPRFIRNGGRFSLAQHSFAPAGILSSSMTRFSFSSPFSLWTALRSIPQLSLPIIFRGGRFTMATRVLPMSSSGL